MDEKLRNWFLDKGRSAGLSNSECKEGVDALSVFFDMDRTTPTFAIRATEYKEASYEEKNHRIAKFVDIENFMKSLLQITDPDLLSTQPAALPHDTGRTSWTLRYLCQRAFPVFGDGDVLSDDAKKLNEDFAMITRNDPYDLESAEGKRKYCFLVLYKFRNSEDHFNAQIRFSDALSINLEQAMVYAMLWCCRKKSRELNGLLEKKKMSFPKLRKEIETVYKEREKKEGFRYVETRWYRKGRNGNESYTAEDLLNENGFDRVKLLGVAGAGKSTALRRLEYLLSSKKPWKEQGTVPIYLDLSRLPKTDPVLLPAIAAKLTIEQDAAAELLNNENCYLLLDGYNEILNPEIQRTVAKEVDGLVRNKAKAKIFLSDRALARPNRPVMEKTAEQFYLMDLEIKDKEEFLKAACTDEQALSRLLHKLHDAPEYFALLDTPLKLIQLVQIVKEAPDEELPLDVTGSYLKALLNRELDDKKDENINYLPTFLEGIACRMLAQTSEKVNEDGQMILPENTCLMTIAKVKNAYGFTIPDAKQCLNLAVDMGILENEGGEISFAQESYLNYFADEAIEHQTDELFMTE